MPNKKIKRLQEITNTPKARKIDVMEPEAGHVVPDEDIMRLHLGVSSESSASEDLSDAEGECDAEQGECDAEQGECDAEDSGQHTGISTH